VVQAFAQQPIQLQTRIQSVRLHPGEAWVTRSGKVSLPSAGNHLIQVGGLSEGLTLDDIRIQASGPVGTTLGEIRVGTESPRIPDTAEAKQLLARLNSLHDRKVQLEAQQTASEKALGFLDAYQQNLTKGSGGGTLPTPAAIMDASRTIEARFAEMTIQSQSRQQELEKINQEMKPLEASWQVIRAKIGADRTPSKITVELITPNSGEIQIELSTRTTSARWKPSYEARVLPGGQMELCLFAAVTQASGEEWEKVRLELSSANLDRTKDLPRFNQVARLNWTPPAPVYPNFVKGGSGATVEIVASSGGIDKTDTKSASNFSRDSTTSVYAPPPPPPKPVLEPVADIVSESEGLFKTYQIDGPRDIPSDGEARRFKVTAARVQAQQLVVVAPRLDSVPYSLVRFELPPGLPLFPGSPVFRFVGQQRLGQSFLVLPLAGQPMQLALGPFQGLRARLLNVEQTQPYQVTKITQVRQNQKGLSQESTKQEVITKGEDRVWTLKDQFILNNDSEQEVNVELQDRLLISVHESIKVRLTKDTTPGSEDSPAQNLRLWKLRIPPRQERKVDLGLEIHAPKEGQVTGLKELRLE
jgi:uncharacterized protein (TIGR02231 family)